MIFGVHNPRLYFTGLGREDDGCSAGLHPSSVSNYAYHSGLFAITVNPRKLDTLTDSRSSLNRPTTVMILPLNILRLLVYTVALPLYLAIVP
jgi:hypothetical protein